MAKNCLNCKYIWHGCIDDGLDKCYRDQEVWRDGKWQKDPQSFTEKMKEK